MTFTDDSEDYADINDAADEPAEETLKVEDEPAPDDPGTGDDPGADRADDDGTGSDTGAAGDDGQSDQAGEGDGPVEIAQSDALPTSFIQRSMADARTKDIWTVYFQLIKRRIAHSTTIPAYD